MLLYGIRGDNYGNCKNGKVALKNNPKIKEDLIQNFIFNDPSVLGLGDISPIQREKI